MSLPHDRRAVLGDSYESFNGLRTNHTRYYCFNTVLALGLLVATSIVYLVVTSTLLANFITALAMTA